AVALPPKTPITPRPVTVRVPNVSAEFAVELPSSCTVLELRVSVGGVAVFSRVTTPARLSRFRRELYARVNAGTPAAVPDETVCVPKLTVVAVLPIGWRVMAPVNVFAPVNAYTAPPAVLANVIPPEPPIGPENVAVGVGAVAFATAPVTTIVLLRVIG